MSLLPPLTQICCANLTSPQGEGKALQFRYANLSLGRGRNHEEISGEGQGAENGHD